MAEITHTEEDDVPQLSSETFAALQQFYKEQELREMKLNAVVSSNGEIDDKTFEENWQLSQFWYDEETIKTLASVAKNSIEENGKIALISCPTLFKQIKAECSYVKLFEYDERFAAFGEDFILYDYKSPLNIPRDLNSSFDLVIADPPFLSDECLTKTAVTIKFLTKNKIVLCTGSVMAELAERLLDLKKCKFEPHHKNNLANEFSCFTNFDLDSCIQ